MLCYFFSFTGTIISSRRLFTQNRQYKIHVKKLKQVNGFKRHNLLIKEVKSENNPLIYINNPVESKIPNAYLTLEEFKQALTNRILTQRETTKIIHLQMTKELKTRLISKKHSKITITTKNNITPKPMFISKLSTNLTSENLTNSTKTFTSSNVPNWSTTYKIDDQTFKDEEIFTTESSKIIKITESVTTNEENITTSTVTALKESTENISAEHPKTLDISNSTIVTFQINTESSNEPETYKTEAPKNYIEETTKLETAENDLPKNTSQLPPTSLHTEELSQKERSIEVVTEDVTETEKITEDPETTIEMVTVTTRSTRKTLGVSDYAL